MSCCHINAHYTLRERTRAGGILVHGTIQACDGGICHRGRVVLIACQLTGVTSQDFACQRVHCAGQTPASGAAEGFAWTACKTNTQTQAFRK